ncbi:peptidase S24 [Proteus mirabilis]|nr:peptidase S24 [Proteus mirabilis]MBN7153805.1 peptidase S24 [Proteus mirabilis]MBN7166455.1 peptidase S24 [Proteus mirabilis]MBN7169495.1 peptidase S24 [Proteus mirabilis]MBN7185849.1 peptidase S24 [Proteus mirabilis]
MDYRLNLSWLVALRSNTNSSRTARFKQLVIDDEQKYLKPLDSQYSATAINDNGTIIGVAR